MPLCSQTALYRAVLLCTSQHCLCTPKLNDCMAPAADPQSLVPISLYVSIELVKLGQVYFLQEDLGDSNFLFSSILFLLSHLLPFSLTYFCSLSHSLNTSSSIPREYTLTYSHNQIFTTPRPTPRCAAGPSTSPRILARCALAGVHC